jgi:O-acetyl-ADP-ribose deacetylase
VGTAALGCPSIADREFSLRKNEQTLRAGIGMSEFSLRIITANGKSVEFHGPADIVLETTDAIVNAANSSLMGGGGVDGAIHRAGGPAILDECKRHVAQHGRLPAGQAMITRGGQLKAKHVIHTVGPVYRDGLQGEAELLANCYKNCIDLADEQAFKSISFPAISTGAYGYPLAEAAKVAITTVLQVLPATKINRVRFVLFDHASVKTYKRAAYRAIKDNRKDFRVDETISSPDETLKP